MARLVPAAFTQGGVRVSFSWSLYWNHFLPVAFSCASLEKRSSTLRTCAHISMRHTRVCWEMLEGVDPLVVKVTCRMGDSFCVRPLLFQKEKVIHLKTIMATLIGNILLLGVMSVIEPWRPVGETYLWLYHTGLWERHTCYYTVHACVSVSWRHLLSCLRCLSCRYWELHLWS